MHAPRVLALLAILGLGPAALAQQDDAAQPAQASAAVDLGSIIKDMASESIQTRIAASSRLLNAPTIALKDIEGCLKRPDLNPEQRQRLLWAAYHRFIIEPRAGMGIQWDNNFGQHGVTLGGVVAGFQAAELLRAGDRIISAGGETIDIWETMRAVIVSRDPGDEIPITIVRDGATLNLKVRLGDFTRVARAQPLDQGLLNQAWEVRMKSMQDPDAAAQAPLGSGLPASAWAPASYTPGSSGEDGEPGRIRTVDSDTSRTTLIAGGEARGGVAPTSTVQNAARMLNTRIMPIDPVNLPAQLPQGIDAAALQRQMQLQAAQARLQANAMVLEKIRQRANDPSLSQAERRRLKLQIDAITNEMQFQLREVQALQQQPAKRPDR